MELIEKIRQLWDHVFWADALLLGAVPSDSSAAPEAFREFAHVIGTEEIWLARLEQRPPRAAVWPELSAPELRSLIEETHAASRAYLAELEAADLVATVRYTNSAGQEFTNSIGDILLHVALHGQYHRGKVNLLLRQAGLTPAPTDYIAFVRGVPAATEATSRRGARRQN